MKPDGVTEEEVRDFLLPLEPKYIALGWHGEGGRKLLHVSTGLSEAVHKIPYCSDRSGAEVFVMFETNEECRSGRKLDGQRLRRGEFLPFFDPKTVKSGRLNGRLAQVRFSVDNKFRRVVDLVSGYLVHGMHTLVAQSPESRGVCDGTSGHGRSRQLAHDR